MWLGTERPLNESLEIVDDTYNLERFAGYPRGGSERPTLEPQWYAGCPEGRSEQIWGDFGCHCRVVERNGDLNLKVVPHLRNIVKLRLRFGCDVIGWDVCAFILSRMCKIRHTLSNAHVPGNFTILR